MAEQNNDNEPKPVKRVTRMQRLKEKCKGTVRFSFIFFSALHVAKIVIAAVYYHNCPAEPEIPKYLLVMGIIGIVTKLISLFKDYLIKRIKINLILSVISTLELTIFIVASYYIYRTYEPNYNPLSGENYCNKTLYLFSFIYMTIIYALILLIIFMVGCFVFALVVLEKYVPDDTDLNPENTTEVSLTDENATKGSAQKYS